MPIRINLKEVFTADSQDLVINKVNFNFNKLLELGIGEDGPIGLTGPIGPAGPTGPTGDPGTPGNIWYVGTTADPNNESFPEVNNGDFYLDTALFTIWRYNGTIWIQQTNITDIINDYLDSAGSVFTRGFGNGVQNDNFIVFNYRGQDESSRLNDNNDILFLNNFDETYLNTTFPSFSLNANAFFNSLLSISVDRSNTVIPYRQHIELGVLYGDGSGTPEGHTSTNESLKIKYERIDSSVLSNGHYNIATLSLDLPETVSTGRTTNGVFNFVSPKKYTGVDTNSNVYIGSRYGLDEVYGVAGTMKADGLLFKKTGDNLYANIGIAQDFLIPNYPASTGYVSNLATNGYFMIDSVNTTLTGVYLNDPLYLTGGNLIQLGNTTPRNVYSTTSTITYPFVPTYKRGGITAVGNTLFTIRGEAGTGATTLTPLVDDIGWFNRFNIEDPNRPRLTMNIYADGQTYGTTRLIGSNASDVAASGNYVYIVNDQNILNTKINGSNKRTYFQILSPNSTDLNYTRLSTLGTDSMFGSSSLVGNDPEELNSAYKVKIKGSYALVATNALHSIGDNWHGRQFLGQYQTSVAGEQYDGYLTAIDITNPAIPKIKSSATNTKETISDWVANNGSATYIQRSAILDFDISGDYAYALAWEQSVSDDAAASAKIYVKLIAFDISNPNAITYHGKSDSATIGTFIDGYYTDPQIDQLVTVGAIASNDQYIYAGYGNMIKVFRTYDKTGSYIFPVASTYTIPGTTSSQFITDIKQFGNSLYAIVNLSPSSTPYTKIYKFNINDSVLTQVWEKEIVGSSGDSIATHFIVIGKHIYCSVHNLAPNNTGLPILITIDYDGMYTSGAHIESLRSDTASVTQNLTVGGHTQLDSSLTVAGPAGIHGELEVGSNARINGELRVSSYGTDTSAIEVGAYRTANGYAYIDLIGDTTYPDYGLRLIRNATGANTTSALTHNGTGNLELITNHAAPIVFKTNGILNTRATIDDTGINLIDGTAALPAYSFITDPDTGMYLIGAGTIGFATDGVLRARIGERGVKVINGTAENPSYSFFNDVDSGMYLVSDGIIGFSVNYYQKAQLDGYGIKLIDGAAGAPSYSFISDDNSGMYLMGAGQIGFTIDGNTARVKIDVGGINLIDGTAGAPSYTFINNTNTGLYLKSNGTLGFTSNGTERAYLNGNGIKLTDGAAANPSYSFIQDAGTGFYWLGASTTGYSAGGNYSIRLGAEGLRTVSGSANTPSYSFISDDNSGMYSIGAGQIGFTIDGNTARVKIDVNGIKLIDGSVSQPSYSFIEDTGTGFYRIDANTIGISTNGALTSRVDTAGIKLINGSITGPSYSFINDTDSGMYLVSDGVIGFATNSVQKAIINTLGIRLISGATANPAYSFIGDTDTGIYSGGTNAIGFSAGGARTAYMNTYGLFIIDGTNEFPSYSFSSDTDSGMYLVSDGVIGFAVNSVERFRIAGDGLTFGAGRTDNGYAYLDLVGDPTYYDYGVRLIRNATGANASSELIHSGTGNLEIITNHSANITFKTNISVDSNPRALINTTGIKLINGVNNGPSYSFITDTDSGMYLVSDGVLGFATNSEQRARIDGYGIKLIDGNATDPSYTFSNNTNTGSYLKSNGTIGFTSNGTERAYLNGEGLNITANGGSLALRGTDHSYIRFFGRGNLANPSDITQRSAYVGFPDSATDSFNIFNQRLNTRITLEESGKFSLRNETAQSIPYTYLQVVTNRATGYVWNVSSAAAGVTLDSTIFAGGNVYLFDTPAGFGNRYWWASDDRNLSIRHEQPGYINLLNTPAYATGSSAVPGVDVPAAFAIGWAPTHSNVHTRFASQDGSTEYANINTNGLNIKNTLKFTEATYEIKTSTDAIILNNSLLQLTGPTANTINFTGTDLTINQNGYNQITVKDDGIKLTNIAARSASGISANTTSWLYYNELTGNTLVSTVAQSNTTDDYDIFITAFCENNSVRSSPNTCTIYFGSNVVSRSEHYNTASALIPAGQAWDVRFENVNSTASQFNYTIVKLGRKAL